MTPISFPCGRQTLAGQLHTASGNTGVLIVPGGAQTRVGAHRMFVDLAQQLASGGVPTLRFDRRGVGDSDGEETGFEAMRADIDAACAAFHAAAPGVERIIGVGHCDGASALALAPHGFAGLVLLNIWTLEGAASGNPAVVKAHYRRRLLQPASWRRLLTGQIDLFGAIGSLLSARRSSVSGLAARLSESLEDAAVPHMHILSERDATALAARSLAEQSDHAVWIANADHGFSDPSHLAEVARQILEFVENLVAEEGLEPPTRGL